MAWLSTAKSEIENGTFPAIIATDKKNEQTPNVTKSNIQTFMTQGWFGVQQYAIPIASG